MKTCTRCKQEFPLNSFYKAVHGDKNGVMYICKKCHHKYSIAYKKKHKDRLNKIERDRYKNNPGMKRAQKLRNLYGLTLEKYNMMLKEQNNACAICYRSESSKDQLNRIKFLSVDHDHQTGIVRSLLCQLCNSALGALKEDLIVAKRLVSYLEKHKDIKTQAHELLDKLSTDTITYSKKEYQETACDVATQLSSNKRD